MTKLGHACLLVEDGDARLLLDPGTYSSGFEDLEGLTGVLVTHQHPDHLDVDRLRALLVRNPDARLHTDDASAGQLEGHGVAATAVHDGDALDLGTDVRVVGRDHAVIHPDVPVVPNVGYLVGRRFLHPGDAYTVPDTDVEVLGMPVGAPWLKAAEAVEYLRAVAPRVAVPIHDGLLSHPEVWLRLYDRLGPESTALDVLDDGASRTL